MNRKVTAVVLATLMAMGTICLPACGDSNTPEPTGEENVPDMPAAEVLDPKNTPPIEKQKEEQELRERGREREDF